jgi:hypothetical protein
MSIAQNYPTISPSLSLDFASVKALDPRITFTRASTGNYYDGRSVARAEENLLLRSQEFDNAVWVKVAASVTANTSVAPDGTTTAETLTASATNENHLITQVITASAETRVVSFFAKKGTLDFVQFAAAGDVNVFANFDLDAGVVGTKGSAVSASSMVDVGNGWFRCISVYASAAAANIGLCLVTNASAARREVWTAAGTETVLLWGAQLEQRSAVTAYTPTTTQPITNYIPTLLSAPANVARFDHNPVTGESLGLLVEEQRTNLVLRSEDFSNAAWSKVRLDVTADTIVAPDGALTGDKIIANTETGWHYILRSESVTSGLAYTLSVFAKKGEQNFIQMHLPTAQFGGTTSGNGAVFDLNAGTITHTGGDLSQAQIVSVGNGWYRCLISKTATATGSAASPITLVNQSAFSTSGYTGDGYSGIYIWGASLEQGQFATSYIKTEASQVTRSADSASMTGANFSDWYRADEGSIYCDFDVSDVGTAAVALPVYSISDATQNNMNTLYKRANADVSTRYNVRANNASVVFENLGTFTNLPTKIGTSYKTNNFIGVRNAGSAFTVTAGIVPIATQLELGRLPAATSSLNGHIKKFAFYPSALTAAQLQALTS